MNLSALITLFTNRTGRLDLTELEITEYINAACKVLDTLEDSGKRPYRIFLDCPASSYILALPEGFRNAFKAILHTADGAVELGFCDAATLMAIYRDDPNIIVDGYENTFTIISTGLISDLSMSEIPIFSDVVGVQTQPSDRNLYVMIYPKADAASTLEIECSAFTAALSDVNDANYWSNTNPGLIIQACQYLLTKDLNNIDEATKLYADLKANVRPIVYDIYEQEHINQMEG